MSTVIQSKFIIWYCKGAKDRCVAHFYYSYYYYYNSVTININTIANCGIRQIASVVGGRKGESERERDSPDSPVLYSLHFNTTTTNTLASSISLIFKPVFGHNSPFGLSVYLWHTHILATNSVFFFFLHLSLLSTIFKTTQHNTTLCHYLFFSFFLSFFTFCVPCH